MTDRAPSEADVERAAEAAYVKLTEQVAILHPGAPFKSWGDLPEEQRRLQIASIRAALSALPALDDARLQNERLASQAKQIEQQQVRIAELECRLEVNRALMGDDMARAATRIAELEQALAAARSEVGTWSAPGTVLFCSFCGAVGKGCVISHGPGCRYVASLKEMP